jgi:hypothetical protein
MARSPIRTLVEKGIEAGADYIPDVVEGPLRSVMNMPSLTVPRKATTRQTSLAAKTEKPKTEKAKTTKVATPAAPAKPPKKKKVATKEPEKTFAVPVSPETSNPLMGLHNTSERKLGMVQRLGGFPVPSLAVVNPENKFEGFGDISLIAPKALVTPKSGNPVYASDVYSARFPALNEDETKIFRGYTDNGRRYAPLTLANVVREMRGNPRNAENWNYGAGSVRAVVTPEFRSMGEMRDARTRIIPSSDFAPLGDEANDMLYALGEKFLPYSKFARPSILDFPEQLAEAARIGFHDLNYNYENLPPELLNEARSYLGHLRDMPTEYFEAKPQRGVDLSEFAGAIVPASTSDEILEMLQNKGVSDIQRYDRDRLRGLPTRQEALNKFRVHRFARGGAA